MALFQFLGKMSFCPNISGCMSGFVSLMKCPSGFVSLYQKRPDLLNKVLLVSNCSNISNNSGEPKERRPEAVFACEFLENVHFSLISGAWLCKKAHIKIHAYFCQCKNGISLLSNSFEEEKIRISK